jgi:hypothetical protein
MAFKLPPDEHQRHRVIIEVDGPVKEKDWAIYRALVKAVARAYDAKVIVTGRLRKARSKKKK